MSSNMMYNVEMKQIQAEITFDELIKEMEAMKVNSPKVFAVYEYTDNQTLVIQYDKFVGILEYDSYLTNYSYVALGRNVSEDLSNKQLQLIDARFLENDELFKKGVNDFIKFIKNKEPHYHEKIKGDKSNEFILGKIEEVWTLAEEKNKAIIH